MEMTASVMSSEVKTKFGKSGSFSSVKTELSPTPEAATTRRRLPEEQKQRLINLITKQNFNMKQASKIMALSYSTVKKIFTRFRNSIRRVPKENALTRRSNCAYAEIPACQEQKCPKITVVSTIAGKEQKRSENIILILKTIC